MPEENVQNMVDRQLEAGTEIIGNQLEPETSKFKNPATKAQEKILNRVLEDCKDHYQTLNIPITILDMESVTITDFPLMCEVINGKLDSFIPEGVHNITLSRVNSIKGQLTKWENEVSSVVSEQVEQIAIKLEEEGVIALPQLKWDGSTGPEEFLVMRRLGFLLDGYQVPCYWWEPVEMYRKLVMTP